MKTTTTLLFLLICGAAMGQHKINGPLKRQLDSVVVLDQKYRDTLTILTDPEMGQALAKKLSLTLGQASKHYWAQQRPLDSANVLFIEAVFKRYGYPGKSLVGSPADESAWDVIQHSKLIHKYIPLIKQAAEHNELPFHLYAMMLDRDLISEGKE